MNTQVQSGFTIVETVLFLAIAGLLTMGILVGSGVAISQQRYRDSVNSLKSSIQQQYSETTNVANNRTNQWTCDANGNIVENQTGGQSRGTSNCVLLGRYVTISDTGTQLTSTSVVGHRSSGSPVAAGDIEELQNNYSLRLSPVDEETEEIRWGAQVVQPKTTTPMPFSLLIIRSPLSGAVMTFSAAGVHSAQDLVSIENMNTERDLCVNAAGGGFVGLRRLGVQIEAYASNQAAVSIPPEGESICD